MTGRPREFDRQTALREAMETFRRRGYEATSVQDLVEATGINRGSMYDTFGSKHALFIEALRAYSESAAIRAREVLGSAEGTPLGNLEKFFAGVEASLYRGDLCAGCLLTNTAVELAQHDAEIAAVLKERFANLRRAFRDTLARAAAAGEIDAGAPLDKLAAFLVSTLQGAVVCAKAGSPRKAVRDTFAIAIAALATAAD